MTKGVLNKKRGFTLIEVLVSIMILIMLSAIVIPNFTNMRRSARDTQRMTDVGVIKNALERYFNRIGEYPENLDNLTESEVRLLSSVPTDPHGASYDYQRSVNCAGVTTGYGYALSFEAESNSLSSDNESGYVRDGDRVCVGP